MKTSQFPRQYFIWLILSLITLSCDLFKKNEPSPEKVCKLLYSGGSTYEYDELYRLTQQVGYAKFNYDDNGYLTEEVLGDGSIINYQYSYGLLSKISYPVNYNLQEENFEYDSKKKLSKRIYVYRENFTSTLTISYNSGKAISYVGNRNGVITQPNRYENGKVVRTNHSNGAFETSDFDTKGRLINYSRYGQSGNKISSIEYSYQDGWDPRNANPRNFFKGFPDEIKDLRPLGLLKKTIIYELKDNLLQRINEEDYTYLLNQMGYATSSIKTISSKNTSGAWITNNPFKYTYAYINCDE